MIRKEVGPMKKLVSLLLVILSVLVFAACSKELKLSSLDLDGTEKIVLTNMHTGKNTEITDKNDVDKIVAFVGEVVGTDDGSGKGYYEGTYDVSFYKKDGETVAVGFGDSDCFYTGKGDDGYPIRYLLKDKTVNGDIVPFFEEFED